VVTIKQNGKPLPDVPGYPLTRLLRSNLYRANDAAMTLKMIENRIRKDEARPPDADKAIALAESQCKTYFDKIGPEWTKRLKNRKTSFGVNLCDLADSLDLAHVYHDFYRPGSAIVHGTDAITYIDIRERPEGGLIFSAVSSSKGVAKSLMTSTLLLLGILNTTNARLGLKLDEQMGGIASRIREMARKLPGE
jgi:hypothetical protein